MDTEVIVQYRKLKKELTGVQERYQHYKRQFESDFAESIRLFEEQVSAERARRVQQQQQQLQEEQLVRHLQQLQHPPGSETGAEAGQEAGVGQGAGQDNEVPLQFQVRDYEGDADTGTPEEPRRAPVHHARESSPVEQPAAPVPQITKADVLKLYRTLCKKFHPDSGADKDQIFVDIQKAYENGDETELVEIALEHGVPVDKYLKDTAGLVQAIQVKISEIQREITTLCATLIWVWCTASQSEKEGMKDRMIQQLTAGK